MGNTDPSAPFDRIVRHMEDFLAARMCSEESFDQVKRNTYKYTDCGAWIEEDKNGITVGSIVEGADYGTTTHVLMYPFMIQEFWDALNEVEMEAKQIWEEVNGEEQ